MTCTMDPILEMKHVFEKSVKAGFARVKRLGWEEKKKKILIVDDEPELLLVLKKRLSHAGYRVIEADSGIEGIRMARKHRPDLIILDLLMPDIGGEEVADILKGCPDTENTPILYLSCLYADRENEGSDYLFGDSVFFGKPYDPERLLGTIEIYI